MIENDGCGRSYFASFKRPQKTLTVLTVRGTGQIRRKVKEDEDGIRIAGARSLSSQAGEASG